MKVELHLIQSFAPSCLNRDDTNAPKSCLFGGIRRARVSSQCLKRATRLYMRDSLSLPTGTRSRLLAGRLADLMAQRGRDKEEAQKVASRALLTLGFAADEERPDRTRVALYLSEDEVKDLASAILDDWDQIRAGTEGEDTKAAGTKKAIRKQAQGKVTPVVAEAAKRVGVTVSALDVALFGRMVAENTNMGVDAACQVAHAISTHPVDAEMDFFTAVDDLQPQEDPGAGMMGIVEYNSACFYRYALVDREQLASNLGGDAALTTQGILGFVRASLEAIPTGRQNSCAAHNLPDYVQVRVGDDLPLSLANAFERPVRPTSEESVVEGSVRRIREYEEAVRRMYGPATGQVCVSSTLPLEGARPVADLLSWLEGCLAEAS